MTVNIVEEINFLVILTTLLPLKVVTIELDIERPMYNEIETRHEQNSLLVN